MTDERLADLLGWHHMADADEDGLLHRIRLIVAEAQAEQDAHIYRLREQLARDTGQIERMRAAPVEAMEVVQQDRVAFAMSNTWSDGSLDPEDETTLRQYDAVIAQADAALGGEG